MNLRLPIFALFIFSGLWLNAQTFTNSVGGAIPDSGSACYPLTVAGLGNISAPFGLAKVCINLTHSFDKDLTISLKAPDGTTILLSKNRGSDGDNYTGTCFTATSLFSIAAGIPPFTGAYTPENTLGDVNNGQNADGTWNLCIIDGVAGDTGVLLNYSLTFNNVPAPPTPPASDNPCGAPLITPLITCTYDTYTTVGATSTTGVPAPGCGNYFGGDVWFKVVVPPAGAFTIDTKEGTMTNAVMSIYKGACNSLTLVKCDDDASANGLMPLINASGLNPGDTIWIRVWGKGVGNFGSFGICIKLPPVPNNQDCPGAIPICQTSYSTTASYVGTGNIPLEIQVNGNSCLQSGEKNDVWYTFTVQTSGNLDFLITPNVNSEDYDWAVYNLSNASCADIFTTPSLSVSCNFSGTGGATGPNGGSALTNGTAGDVPFNAVIPVTAGQTYVINVSNFSNSNNGYTINFAASTATIYDNVPPALKTAAAYNTCGSSQVVVSFTENVQCSSVQPLDFLITGPGGPYTVTGYSSAACGSGATYGNNFTLTVSPALTAPGNYQACLTLASGSVSDLCGNLALPSCLNFTIKPSPALGGDKSASICTGSTVNLTTLYTITGLTPTWTFGGTAVANPASVSAAGVYQLIVANASGCKDTALVTLAVNANIRDTTTLSLCTSQLPYVWHGNSYNTSGTYLDTVTSASTCDSILTLNLSISPSSSSLTDTSVCPSQLPFVWNGSSYSAAGSYPKTLVNAAGCDSIATLNLGVKTVSASTTSIALCSTQFPYVWNGNSYSGAGTYTKTLVNAVGCDSVATLVITLKANSASTTNVALCPPQLPYIWNGNSYSTTGTYTKTLVNAAGCDSIATLVLTIQPATTSTTNVAVCSTLLPYVWNGNSYSTAGTYTKTLQNAAGCDSIATLVLAVKLTSASTTNIAVCPTQLPYVWNGNSYNAAGTYTKTFVNAAGCDSVASLVLSLKSPTASITNVAVCPSQVPYVWNGNSYSAAGTYTKTLVNAVGCDSVATLVLSIKSTSSSTTNTSVCSNLLPYSWNGNSYNAAGTYIKTLVNAAGCDSVATLNLSVKATSASTTNASVCPVQLPYVWNGNNYNTTGTFTKTLVNAMGCDSVTTLNLIVKANSSSVTTVSICPTQLPYVWNGNAYNAGGNYTKTLVNAAGCDSVANLALIIKPTSASTTNVGVCPSQLPYVWNGNSYNSAGTYTKTLVNAGGCDSVATLVLTIKLISASTTNINVCPSQLPFAWNGSSYNGAGTYVKTLVNAAGCDSVATLNLGVKSNSSSITNTSICSTQLPYLWNGNSYNTAGTYVKTLVNAAGCDSVATLNLLVKASSVSITNVSVCPVQLPYVWNGNNYNTTGTFTKTLVNAVGCDSVATLNLTVKANSSSLTNVSLCPSQLPYVWNGNNYNTAGTYTKTLVNAAGCDSVAKLVLTVKSTSASTTNVGVCPSQLPYVWNGNNYNVAGTYTKTLVNAAGCDSVATLVFTIKSTSSSITNTSVCPSQLPYVWNGNSYNAAGTYTKTLVNAAGCDSVATLNLSVKSNSASTTNTNICSTQLPYLWNGNSYNASGTYTKTLLNAAGCDSVATLQLLVKSTSASTTNVSICPAQLPYVWNGNNYNGSGTFIKTLVNAVGCDSIATLVLNVKSNTLSATNVSICPSQLPYVWNGNSYSGAGVYTKTLVNAAGCDSVARLILVVKANSSSVTTVQVCPSQFPYLWNGNSYSAAGTYTKTLVNAAGCDSTARLVLIVKSNSASTTVVRVCPSQLPYTWNGNSYSIAGAYTKTLVNAAGCDSIATLNLVVKATSASTTNVHVCPSQLPYVWNGNSYNTTGVYIRTLVNAVGCDSIATLNFTVNTTSTSITGVTICSVQLPYLWNGNSYTSTGTFTKTLANSNGCDSIATLKLVVNPNPALPIISTNTPICSENDLNLSVTNAVPNATYRWTGPNNFAASTATTVVNNITVGQSGVYYVTATLNGCVSQTGNTRVVVNLTPVANAGPDKLVIEGDSIQLTPVITATGLSYAWSPTTFMLTDNKLIKPWVVGIEDIAYYLTVSNGICTSEPDMVLVKVTPRLNPIVIPNVFSPNGDGKNDVWMIRELGHYPDAKVEVFTRYGINVYNSFGGYRPWDGTSKGKLLPLGTYYYIIHTTKQSKPLAGWVQIVR